MHRSVIPTRSAPSKLARTFRWFLVALVAAALVAGALVYSTKVVKECVASGESTLWCVSTLRLQSWKQLWG
jgi:hypothetical protein